MANWQVISLDTATPQLRAPGTGDGYSFNSGSTQLGVWTTTGLGVGTANPAGKLVVSNAGAAGIEFYPTGGVGGGPYLGTYNRSTSAYIPYTNYASTHTWFVSTAGNVRAMDLDASGNLGIGTSSPAYKLDVSGTNDQYIRVTTTTAGAAAGIRMNSTGSREFGIFSDGSLRFYDFTASATRVTLDSSGNLGLGVTPSAWDTSVYRTLQVGSGPGSAALFGRTDNANNVGLGVNYYVGAGNQRYIANGTASYYNQQNGIHSWHFAPTNTSGAGAIASFAQAMTLDAAGRLLVGGTSAIVGASNGSIEVQNTGQEQFSLARFTNGSGAPTAYFNKSRGATVGTNTIVNDGDFLGIFSFRGANGTGYSEAASILAAVDGTPGASNDMPGRLIFATAADGTAGAAERMRIDSSGRLLLNTSTSVGVASSATGLQQIASTAASIHLSLANYSASSDGGILAFGKSRGTTVGSATIVNDGDNLGEIRFAGADGTDLQTEGGGIRCQVDGTPGSNDMPGRLVFLTTPDGSATPTERMRITSAGSVLVGTTDTNPSGNNVVGIALTASGNIGATRSGGTAANFNRSTSEGAVVSLRYAGAEVGTISVTASATAYNTSSDRRLKSNIVAADDAGAVVDAIQVVKHDWKIGGHVRYGVIAQDLHAVAPEAVKVGDDGEEVSEAWGVDYSKLVPMLVKEIQSLRARVAQLEAK